MVKAVGFTSYTGCGFIYSIFIISLYDNCYPSVTRTTICSLIICWPSMVLSEKNWLFDRFWLMPWLNVPPQFKRVDGSTAHQMCSLCTSKNQQRSWEILCHFHLRDGAVHSSVEWRTNSEARLVQEYEDLALFVEYHYMTCTSKSFAVRTLWGLAGEDVSLPLVHGWALCFTRSVQQSIQRPQGHPAQTLVKQDVVPVFGDASAKLLVPIEHPPSPPSSKAAAAALITDRHGAGNV